MWLQIARHLLVFREAPSPLRFVTAYVILGLDDSYLLDEHEKSAMLPLLDSHSQLVHLIF
jgi:hypothetical protein